MRSLTGLAIAALALAAAAPTASAEQARPAKRAPCTSGEEQPLCFVRTGTVKPVDDGDTINVKIRGDGIRERVKVRLTGIQAMELTSYSRKHGRAGECHSVEATERLQQVIRATGRRVRLAALHEDSATGSRHRLRRHVSVRYLGRWVDVAALMLSEGHALWFPNRREWAWNRSYSQLAAEAAAAGIGIWDTDACGTGPHQESPLAMKVKWDGAGTERTNMTREWVRVTNTDPVNAVSLRGWWLRDSHLRRYRFPGSTVIPPGGSIKVFAGDGSTTDRLFYWGQPRPVFENVVGGRRSIGDGAYLFDPHGDLRAWAQYPCRVGCHEPLRRRVHVHGYKRDEIVVVRNTSNAEISLAGYDLESSPWFYEFGPGDVLAPGKALVLWMGLAGYYIPNDTDPPPGPPPGPPPQQPPPGGGPEPPPPPPDDDCDDPLGGILPCPTARAAAPRRFRNVARVKSWGFRRPLLANRRDAVTLRNPIGAPVVCHAWGGQKCPGA
jgi:endonuclease YncB( thermonuclease family)